MPPERILFVTGRLAEFSLRRVLEPLARAAGFEYDVAVLGISVAALLQTEWIARKLEVPPGFDRVIVTGWCRGDLDDLSRRYNVPFERGPKDLFDLPEYFGRGRRAAPDLTKYTTEILAEINHADRLPDADVVRIAEHYRADGADVIDLGGTPGEPWPRVGEVTGLLRSLGFRVSVDSFDQAEVEAAVAAGAELVLSCNSSNLEWAARLGVELVAIPDDPRDWASLEQTVAELESRGTPFRIDPILEPIGFGFAASLARYARARERWPRHALLMGIGNLTELTEVDTAGINVLLAGLCEELQIRSVLTTEVINWARTAVREFDLARRLMRHSIEQRVLPKHIDDRLVMLRDPRLVEMGEDGLRQLAAQVADPNLRIYVERGELHVLNRDGYWRGTDPYELFDAVERESGPFTSSHAFYFGYEMAKAAIALTLGKQYRQDEALRWGFLTRPERSALEHRKRSE